MVKKLLTVYNFIFNLQNFYSLNRDTYLVGRGCCSLQSFRTSRLGRNCTHYVLSALETMRIVPNGTTNVHSVLLTAADGLVASRKIKIFTPMLRILAKKPEN